ILGREHLRKLMPVLRIEDAPYRQVLGRSIGPAFVHGDAHPRRAFAHEALAMAVHQDAMAGIGLEQRLGMAMALVPGEGGAGDKCLVHVRELSTYGRSHALAVTGVAAR